MPFKSTLSLHWWNQWTRLGSLSKTGRSVTLRTSMAAVKPSSPRLMPRSMLRSLRHSRSVNWFVPSTTRHPNAYCIFTSLKAVPELGLRTCTTWQTSEACSTRTTRILSSVPIQRNTNRRLQLRETIKKASLSKPTVAMAKHQQLFNSHFLAQLGMPRARRASRTQRTFLPADTVPRSYRISWGTQQSNNNRNPLLKTGLISSPGQLHQLCRRIRTMKCRRLTQHPTTPRPIIRWLSVLSRPSLQRKMLKSDKAISRQTLMLSRWRTLWKA